MARKGKRNIILGLKIKNTGKINTNPKRKFKKLANTEERAKNSLGILNCLNN